MPRPTKTVPTYRLHGASGQAVVSIGGKLHYLGVYESAESREKYARLLAGQTATPAAPATPADVTVSVVIVAFLKHAQTYYRHADGTPTSEARNYVGPLRLLRKLYGPTPAGEFGPLKLKKVREEMIRLNWSRKRINREVVRLVHVFKRAVENELVSPSILHGLQAVSGLRANRSEARETSPVRPVPDAQVDQTVAASGRVLGAMIRLQHLTGMRSGELVQMRTADIDTSGPVWQYVPRTHKNAHRGQPRVVFLGQQAQAVVGPFLRMDRDAYLFSPADAEADRRADMAAKRKTPQSCGNRPGSNRTADPKRTPGASWTTESYHRAVTRACDRAFPAPAGTTGNDLKVWRKSHRWHPHQLRHSAATRIRREFGLDAARTALGQKSLAAATIYAEADMAKAREVAAAMG